MVYKSSNSTTLRSINLRIFQREIIPQSVLTHQPITITSNNRREYYIYNMKIISAKNKQRRKVKISIHNQKIT